MSLESLPLDDGQFIRVETELENFQQILFLTLDQDEVVMIYFGLLMRKMVH